MLVVTVMIWQLAVHVLHPEPMGFIHTPRFTSVADCREYLVSPEFGVLREQLALEVAAHLNPTDPFKTREQLAITSTCELDKRV